MAKKCAVLITSHDRPHLTAATVREVIRQLKLAGLIPTVFLIDSSVGPETENALADLESAELRYERVSSDVYWAGGMYMAEKAAIRSAEYEDDDILLWLNDDVELDPDAIRRSLHAWLHVDQTSTILIGAMRDPHSGELSFSGKNRQRSSPTRFVDCAPGRDLRPVGTFNGNFVWLSFSRNATLGGINRDFIHHGADIEFGIRNEQEQGWNMLLPGTVGASVRKAHEFQSIALLLKHAISPLGVAHFSTRKNLLGSMGFQGLSLIALSTLGAIASGIRALALWKVRGG